MKKAYYGSLYYQGIRGGGIFVDGESVVYQNQTHTLPREYKTIVIKIKDIAKVEKKRLLLLPTVKIYLENGKSYEFVIFNRKDFLKRLRGGGGGG